MGVYWTSLIRICRPKNRPQKKHARLFDYYPQIQLLHLISKSVGGLGGSARLRSEICVSTGGAQILWILHDRPYSWWVGPWWFRALLSSLRCLVTNTTKREPNQMPTNYDKDKQGKNPLGKPAGFTAYREDIWTLRMEMISKHPKATAFARDFIE